MLNFNKLPFIVFEIFDNSQLFLTDPRSTKFSYNFVKIRYMHSTNYAYNELKREVHWNS